MSDDKDCIQAATHIQGGIEIASRSLTELVGGDRETSEYQKKTAAAKLEQAIHQLQHAQDVLEEEQ